MGNTESSEPQKEQDQVQDQVQEQEQEQGQEDPGISPIIEAKSLLSNGDVAGAFSVLKKAAESGDVMACYDAGFMKIQGIGCDKNWRSGLKLMFKGMKLKEDSEDLSWKSDGSAT